MLTESARLEESEWMVEDEPVSFFVVSLLSLKESISSASVFTFCTQLDSCLAICVDWRAGSAMRGSFAI